MPAFDGLLRREVQSRHAFQPLRFVELTGLGARAVALLAFTDLLGQILAPLQQRAFEHNGNDSKPLVDSEKARVTIGRSRMRLLLLSSLLFACAHAAEPAYVGASTCSQCHRAIADPQAKSNMGVTWQGSTS